MKISGIYKIINKLNGKYYIGSSHDIIGKRGRWFWHKQHLNRNVHKNVHLQSAWNKYGENAFDWVILEETCIEDLYSREQCYLNICKLESDCVYNISFNASRPMLGRHHTIETKRILSERFSGKNNPMYNKQVSIYTRNKISDSNKGRTAGDKHYNFNKHLSENTKRKISESGKGLKRTEETKKHISYALKNRVFSGEHLKNLSLSHIGKNVGNKHPNFNHTIYELKNIKTNEIFVGYRNDFINKYSIPSGRCSKLLNGKISILKGWVVCA